MISTSQPDPTAHFHLVSTRMLHCVPLIDVFAATYIIEFGMLNSFVDGNTDQKSYFRHNHESNAPETKELNGYSTFTIAYD